MPNLDAAPLRTRRSVARAVVLGAGLAGLAAAAALADRAERVTVIERDPPPPADALRRGVPQGGHVHLLLPAGVAALERLLPGLTDDLRDADAQLLRKPDDFAIHLEGGRLALGPLDPAFVLVGATRPLVERVVRRRVGALPNVEIVGGLRVVGLVAGPADSLAGVQTERVDGSGVAEAIAAELVVDASGRGSRAPRWLAALGYDAPREQSVRVDVRYTTRSFRRPPEPTGGARNVLVATPAGERRGAVALAVEGDRWLVSLTGLHGEQPPGDLDGFLGYARSLWCPAVHALAAHEEPIGEAVMGACPGNVHRRWDRIRRLPGGFVVTGDALAAFNPLYGQGMSMAALEAETLAAVLDRVDLDRIGPAFFRALRGRVEEAWSQAIDSDLRHPQVAGPRGPRWRAVTAYAQRLLPVAHRDPVVGRAFLEVMAMRAPGASLLRPAVATRVLLRSGANGGRGEAGNLRGDAAGEP